jgi:Flp pilus assembly protein TadG
MKLQGRARRSPTPRSLLSGGQRFRGQALVEFAIVFPIFLIVLGSVLYFGFLLYSKMSIINAAREGAHYGILLDPADAAFDTQVSDQVQGAAGAGLNSASVMTATEGFKVDPTTHLVTTNACTWGSGGTCVAGDAVNVTVTYPFANPIPLHLVLLGNVIIDLPSSIDLTSTVQMIHE